MKDEIPVLHSKLNRYERKLKRKSQDGKTQITTRYMIPIRKDQIEGTKFEEVEDIIIMSSEDFQDELQKSHIISISNEKLKQQLNDKKLKIRSLNDKIRQKKMDEREELTAEFNFKIENRINEYEEDKIALQSKMEKEIAELKDQLKSLRDLRILEKESFKIKLNELELNNDEYASLKRSHEILGEMVQRKNERIRDLEKKGMVNNLLSKIKK